MVPGTEAEKSDCNDLIGQWQHRLPSHVRQSARGWAPSVAKTKGICRYFGLWPLEVAKSGAEAVNWNAPGVLVLDDSAATGEDQLHQAWRLWLHTFNTIQSLPGVCLVTSTGLDAQDYTEWAPAEITTKAQPAHQAALNAAWDHVLSQAMKSMHPGLFDLAKAGAEPPEMGPELADEKGKVIADAELSWASAMLSVLRDDQSDLVKDWADRGWSVLVLDETQEKIDGKDWAAVVAEHLKLALPNKE
jgi:DEAD/DEAH box helicase domain-containing protein